MEGESSYTKEQWDKHNARVAEIVARSQGRLTEAEIIRLARLLDARERGELTPDEDTERAALVAKLGGKEMGAESE